MTLTAEDRNRCDGCSARALVLVFRDPDGPLQFCGHHYGKLAEPLAASGWTIQMDERDRVPS